MTKLSLNASKKTKHTPAGEIPVDWGSAVLSDIIANLESGVSVSGEDRPANANESGVLRVSAVSKGRFFPKENKAILPADLKRARMRPRAGAILVSRSNTPDLVGESARVPASFPNLFLPDKLWQVCLRPETPTDEGWLSYVLQFPDVRRLISERASGTSKSMRNISKPSFLSIPIPLPPLPEQRRIADILSTWDRAIETLESLIAAKERRKQALMQHLLTGKMRLPEFTQDKWRKVRMSEILERVFRPIDWHADKQLSLVSLRRRCGGLFRRPDMLGAEYKTQDLHELKTDDFLISKRQVSHGAWGIVSSEFEGSHVSKEYAIFVNKDSRKLHMPFFAWLAQTPRMIRLARVASTGVHIEKLIFDPVVFLRESISIPPTIKEQQAIASVLDTADRELTLHRQHLATLRTQKRGLMKLLLTGAVRVKS
jgi:type I restriction enzyme, S subunit